MVDPDLVLSRQFGDGSMIYHNQSGDHMPACTQSHQNFKQKCAKDPCNETLFYFFI